MFPNILMGRLTALQFAQKTVYTDNGPMGLDVMRVRFVAPDGDEYYHDLPNGDFTLSNKSLQFMAKWGYQPSGLGNGTHYDAYENQKLIPIVHVGESEETDCEYALAETAMKGAERLLKNAEWFDTDEQSDGDSSQSEATGGGSDDDPSTGNRGAVEIEESEKDGVGMEAVVQ
jgi:hypothetical protein